MRILFITHEDSKFGASKSFMEMIIGLKLRYNIEPVVLTCSYNKINEQCEALNIENFVTKHRRYVYTKNKSFYDFIKLIPKYIRYKLSEICAERRIKKLVNIETIDLVHTNTSIISLGARISNKNKIPHIWHIREFGDIDFNFVPFIRNQCDFIEKNSTKCIAISNAVKDHWVSKGLDASKILTIYNGININNVIPKKNYSDQSLKIVFSGSITENKGQIQLIEAINLLPEYIKNNIYIDILGSGNRKYKLLLENKVKSYGLSDIINFRGYCDDLTSHLSNYDVGVVCSKSEGFGRVTVEYMAAGLCVIVSNTGANTEIVENMVTGLVYNLDDIEDLKNKIEYIYFNRDIIKEFGIAGYKKVINNFTKENNANNVFNLYKKTLNLVE